MLKWIWAICSLSAFEEANLSKEPCCVLLRCSPGSSWPRFPGSGWPLPSGTSLAVLGSLWGSWAMKLQCNWEWCSRSHECQKQERRKEKM